jgi:hypothetical protein
MASAPADLCERYRITARQFDHWCRNGWIRAVQDGVGTGYPRRLPEGEELVLGLMALLVRNGVRPPVACLWARALVANGYFRLEDSDVIVGYIDAVEV